MYFLSFRIIEQLALARKNRVALEIWNCIVCIFYYSGFLSNSALARKYLAVLNILLHSGVFLHFLHLP